MRKNNRFDICDVCGDKVYVGDWPFCDGDKKKHTPARPARHEFEAIIIYRDAQGNVRVPGNGNWKPPKGWQKEEIRTRIEADRVSKELNGAEYRKWEELRQRESHFFEANFGRNRAEIERMREGVDDPKIREFMDIAMRQGDERDRAASSYSPGMYWGVLE